MILHINILYYLIFTTIYIPLTVTTRNKDLFITSGMKEISPCSVALQFVSVLNNTSDEDLFVELLSDECCIGSGETLDCDSLEIIGESSVVVGKGKVKILTLVAPILDPFERKGYCTIHVDSRLVEKRNNIMRDNIKIDFDTRINKNKEILDIKENIKKCKNKDEDPLNDCKPVDCDTYYNGKKPVYDKNTRRCVEVPKCRDKKFASKVYDPVTNTCIDKEPINTEDLDFVKSLNKDRATKDVIIVESYRHPGSYNATFLDYGTTGNDGLSNVSNNTRTKLLTQNNHICGCIIKYLTANKYTILVLGMVIFVQCCLICTMIYCLTKRSINCDKKKVERKYFNYRQDVSVTTPLIGTSNIDTETTGFDYVSESSNIDKKIKCYKACQKERKNDTKISMSDDILSKCLNRRSWNMKPKSDANYNIHNFYDNNISHADWNFKKSNLNEIAISEKAPSEKKEHKEEEKQPNEVKQDVGNKYKEDYTDSDSSEKLIQCHDYIFSQSKRNVGDERFEPKILASVSTEKGAQACFSNDSIDDFLSERGIVYVAGETLSKYSFATNSTPNSSLELSGKTSKNNIVKNVLSYLSRKSKICTSSDPGVKKSKSKDLELIHMSRASVCSSSASDFKNLKGVKLAKESRSSL